MTSRPDGYRPTFAHRAAAYHAAMSLCPHARDAEFRALLARCRAEPAAVMADIPCGGGYLARFLPPATRVVGIDPAVAFLKPQRARARQAAVCAEMTRLPLPDCALDAVLSLAGLHHEADKPAVFREWHRALKPGGQLHIADVAADSPPQRFLDEFVHRHNPHGHTAEFLDDALIDAMRGTCFALTQRAHTAFPWRFPDLQSAVRFCRLLFGLTTCPDAVLGDALARYLDLRAAASGFILTWELTFVSFRRLP